MVASASRKIANYPNIDLIARAISEITSSEIILAGNLINIWDNSGSNVRNADATAAGKECSGFVLEDVSLGGTALVYFEGKISGLVGLTPGATYYMATTVGAITSTPPAIIGNVIQKIGTAISTTELSFSPGEATVVT